ICEYMAEARIDRDQPALPLFRAARGKPTRSKAGDNATEQDTREAKAKQLTVNPLDYKQIWDMVKRRLRQAGLPRQISPHSFRVKTITDLLSQGVPMEDVQNLAGHADPRTTRIYYVQTAEMRSDWRNLPDCKALRTEGLNITSGSTWRTV